jgi:hypothetical protein
MIDFSYEKRKNFPFNPIKIKKFDYLEYYVMGKFMIHRCHPLVLG